MFIQQSPVIHNFSDQISVVQDDSWSVLPDALPLADIQLLPGRQVFWISLALIAVAAALLLRVF